MQLFLSAESKKRRVGAWLGTCYFCSKTTLYRLGFLPLKVIQGSKESKKKEGVKKTGHIFRLGLGSITVGATGKSVKGMPGSKKKSRGRSREMSRGAQ